MRSDLAGLDGREFDVAIVGAGINGASAAQHLAAAGFRVLLVDKGDFASGASSRSSRLLHCGLRYLAPGRSMFDFVRHPSRLAVALRMARLAMEARAEFVKTSPERARPVRLHFPIYRGGPYSGWQVDLAFSILNRFGDAEVPLDYKRLTRDEASRTPLISGLRDGQDLQSVAAFTEYQFEWPERIALDAIGDAQRLGAAARNYTKARMASHAAGQGWSVELTDMLDQTPPVTVRARMVLNMAGVWIDDVLQDAKRGAGRKVFGTKGAHIVVQLPPDCSGLGIATLNSLGLPFYCVPWRGMHYFGPTETAYEGDHDRVSVTADEVEFLLSEANRLLPSLKLTGDDVIMTWAGVRPLTYDEAVPFGNRSRVVHDLSAEGLPDAIALTAGPVMTHRSAGRELTALVAKRISPSGTPRVANYAAPEALEGTEQATCLSDLLFRRRGVAWSGPPALDDLDGAARELSADLEWDEARREREIAAFSSEWDSLYGVKTKQGNAGRRP